jgi:hypothetical protein
LTLFSLFVNSYSADQMKIDSENRANEKIAGFEAELVQMRERSQKILADKDNEIEILRKQNDGTEAEQSDSVGQLMLNGDANTDTALIMYAEQVIHCILFLQINSLSSWPEKT